MKNGGIKCLFCLMRVKACDPIWFLDEILPFAFLIQKESIPSSKFPC